MPTEKKYTRAEMQKKQAADESAAARKASRGFMNARGPSFKNTFSRGFASAAERESSTIATNLGRVAQHVVGSGVGRENIMNSLGMLTKHQKAEAAATKGMMRNFASYAVPLGAAYGMYETMSEGGNIGTMMLDYGMVGAAAEKGWHIGKHAGYAGSKMLGGSGRGLLISGVTSGVVGAGLGLLASSVLSTGIQEMTSSNSTVANLEYDMTSTLKPMDFEESNNTLTHKRRALSKLSKSALNDRGTLLGNEAGIIAGLY